MKSYDPITSARAAAAVLQGGPGTELSPGGAGVLVCRIAGDLDIESLEPAKEALDSGLRGNRLVVVDLEHVTFCDSSGLNMLLVARASALATGTGLRLAAVSQPVKRLLEITGAATAFDLYATVREAVEEVC
ncbi:STAS domain-containing protein [Kitasatospora sp. NPDC096147]|uniref:STAS domain-containing protein n=1 Tax=Kitasatospora sp. NPDC096147 TaxID=3364093 RepID=UPI003806F9EC